MTLHLEEGDVSCHRIGGWLGPQSFSELGCEGKHLKASAEN